MPRARKLVAMNPPSGSPRTEFNPETIRERLEVASYIHKGLKVVWHDETTGKKEVFRHEDGEDATHAVAGLL